VNDVEAAGQSGAKLDTKSRTVDAATEIADDTQRVQGVAAYRGLLRRRWRTRSR
jgi:hypothetical protein